MALARRKTAAVALAVVGVAGLTLASAAQVDVDSQQIGAGTAVVGSCDDVVDVTFGNAYDAGAYRVTSVVVADVAAACDGSTLAVTLVDPADAALVEVSGTVSGGSLSLDVPAASLPAAEDVAGVAVVIAG
nr:hypothetical protein [uncultured Actinotalea sp.]